MHGLVSTISPLSRSAQARRSVVASLGSKPTRFRRHFFGDRTLLCASLNDRSRRRHGQSAFLCRAHVPIANPARKRMIPPQISSQKRPGCGARTCCWQVGQVIAVAPQRGVDPDFLPAVPAFEFLGLSCRSRVRSNGVGAQATGRSAPAWLVLRGIGPWRVAGSSFEALIRRSPKARQICLATGCKRRLLDARRLFQQAAKPRPSPRWCAREPA